ncbi:MAG TPA: LysR family transcriptional regulator [Solirubrobacteraceae bacterium]|nr:LysR family transcriptional regulator [Solirubrobacteraceae bacterium]
MRRADDLIELRLLVSVAESGSLGQAALRHGLTQPAVSARMNALERRLGLTLLRRDTTGTSVTPVGQELVVAARRVLAAAEDFSLCAERHRAASESRLRVAASFTIAEHLLPTWIRTLHATDPELAVAVDVVNSTRVLAAVVHAETDLGFVEGTERDLAGVSSVAVASDALVVVVSPDHPWALRHEPLSGPELAQTGLIVREPGSGTREVLDRALAPWGGTRARLELGSSTAVLGAARRGEGPAVLGRLAAADDLSAGRVRLAPVSGVDLSRTLRAVWPHNLALSAPARRLLGVAREHERVQRSLARTVAA